MQSSTPVGIVLALNAEARSCAAWQRAAGARVALTGPGGEQATRGARDLAEQGVSCLVSWGTSGALAPQFGAGQLLLITATATRGAASIASDPALLAAAAELLAPLNPAKVSATTVSVPVSEPGAKRALAAEGALSVDMESAAVASVAAQFGLPFLAIRAVVDPLAFRIPGSALAGMGDDGKSHPLKTGLALLRHPGELPDLLKLAWHYNAALGSLTKAARLLAAAITNPAYSRAFAR